MQASPPLQSLSLAASSRNGAKKTSAAGRFPPDSMTKAIRAAIARIAREHPALGRHLDATIRTGRLFSYSPDPRVPVSWSV